MFGIPIEMIILYFVILAAAQMIISAINRLEGAKYSFFGQTDGDQELLRKFFENIYKPYSAEDSNHMDPQEMMRLEENPPSLYDVVNSVEKLNEGYTYDYHEELTEHLKQISERIEKLIVLQNGERSIAVRRDKQADT